MNRSSINQYIVVPMVLFLVLLNAILILYFYNEWRLVSQNTAEASFYGLDVGMQKAYIAFAQNSMGLLLAIMGIELTALFFKKGILAMTLLVLFNVLGYFFILS